MDNNRHLIAASVLSVVAAAGLVAAFFGSRSGGVERAAIISISLITILYMAGTFLASCRIALAGVGLLTSLKVFGLVLVSAVTYRISTFAIGAAFDSSADGIFLAYVSSRAVPLTTGLALICAIGITVVKGRLTVVDVAACALLGSLGLVLVLIGYAAH